MNQSPTSQIHVLPTEYIKPSSATPSQLKHYNLSSMDQMIFPIYIPFAFFFRNNPCNDPTKTAAISTRLKLSLSKTLSKYYPFAGELTSETYVDCNDKGVEFQEAEIKSRLCDVFSKQNKVDPDMVFPPGLAANGFFHGSSPMIVRLSHFSCGGIALAVCLSHRLADVCTFSSFLTYWAEMACNSCEPISPRFISHPSSNMPIPNLDILPPKSNLVTKSFFFKDSKIAQLKTMVSSSVVKNPTRFEAIISLLYKCALSAAISSSVAFRPSVLLSAVNMRSMMVPPLPQTSVGNIVGQICIRTKTVDGINLKYLTEQINEGKKKFVATKVGEVEVALTGMNDLRENNYKVYFSSSWCNFGLNMVDFGCGKPSRLIHAGPPLNNSFVLMDTASGDGIEAEVTLDEEDMVKFELESDLLSFASLD